MMKKNQSGATPVHALAGAGAGDCDWPPSLPRVTGAGAGDYR